MEENNRTETSKALIESIPLRDLVNGREKIIEKIIESEGEVDDTTMEMLDVAKDLIEGKVDRVAIYLKEVIPSHIEACEQQIETLKSIKERIKKYTQECIMLQLTEEDREQISKFGLGQFYKEAPTEKKSLEGLAYKMRLQANPDRLEITNPDHVPSLFKKVRVTIQHEFDVTNFELTDWWEKTIEHFSKDFKFKGEIEFDVDMAEIKKVIKSGSKVDGVSVTKGVHLRIDKGTVKAKKKITKKTEG